MLATWITLSRLPVLLVAIATLYAGSLPVRLIGAGALLLGLLLDTADGLVARRRKETSLLGSVLDIALDRTYELVLWTCFAHLGLVPLAVPVVVASRIALTDAIRSVGARAGTAPFDQIGSALGRLLVASSWMRIGYGASKVLAFVGLAMENAGVWPAKGTIATLLQIAVWGCVCLCVVRGIPVVLEGVRGLTGQENPSASPTIESGT